MAGPGGPVTGIDHVIAGVGLGDLSVALTGVDVVPGGNHAGLGTRNALVPLAGAYVELIAVRDRAEALVSPFARTLPALVEGGAGGWVGFAVATSAPAALAGRLRARGHDVAEHPGRRRRPGGEPVVWTMLAVDGPPWGRARPFAIAWASPPPRAAGGGPDLAGVVVEAPDPAGEARWWVDALGAVPAGPTAVTVGRHRVEFRAGSGGLAEVLVRGLDAPVPLPGGAVLTPAREG